MKPWWRSPSWGTVHAGPARLAVWVLVLLSPMFVLLLLVGSPYLVTLRAAWGKARARRVWRIAAGVSVIAAVATATAAAWLVPQGIPLALPPADPWTSEPDPLITNAVVGVNALLMAGVALLPLAAASALETVVGPASRHSAHAGEASADSP